jgi:hypothetical protein
MPTNEDVQAELEHLVPENDALKASNKRGRGVMDPDILIREIIEIRINIQSELIDAPTDDYNEADQWLANVPGELREGRPKEAAQAWNAAMEALSRARFHKQKHQEILDRISEALKA